MQKLGTKKLMKKYYVHNKMSNNHFTSFYGKNSCCVNENKLDNLQAFSVT